MVTEAMTTVQFDAALLRATARAAATYPTERERIERGLQIALAEGVTFLPTGLALVASQSRPGETYPVNGHCLCRDVAQAPAGRCKHRWAKSLVRWARNAEVDTPPPPVVRCPRCWVAFADDEAAVPGDVCVVCAAIEATPALNASPSGDTPATPPTIPAQYVVSLHGKSFVQYTGLLAMAHARGLVSLKVHFISVTDALGPRRSRGHLCRWQHLQ